MTESEDIAHGPAGWDDASLIDVGGHRLAFRQAGEAAPVVALEMGLGTSGSSYDAIAQRVASFARVVWYDHAGVGCSEPAPKPRTIADLAADLHTLLHAVQIPPPYALVGHSLGGLTVRYYQRQYPTDVAALVLIDSAHEEQRERLLATLPPESPDEAAALAQYRQALAVSWADPQANDEGIDNLANSALMRHDHDLGDLPLVVISRGQAQAPIGWSPELQTQREQVWRQMQRELAALSSRSVHLIAERSGHLVHKEQPDIIVEGIRQAVSLVRNLDARQSDI